MSFDKKYRICRSCTYAKITRKIGLTCSLTQSKPDFVIYCETFNYNAGRDKKVQRKNRSFYSDNELIIWTLLIIILFFQFIVSQNFVLLILLIISAGIFYYIKLLVPLPDKIIRKIGWFGYSFISLSAEIIKNKENPKNELKLVFQKLLREYDYETSREGVKITKELFKKEINVKEICSEIKNRYSPREKILLYYLLFEVAILDNFNKIEDDLTIKRIAKYLEINEKHKFYIKEKIISEKNKTSRKQKKEKKREKKFTKKNDFQIQNAYQILNVNIQSTDEEIKKSFRKLAMQFHPDKANLNDEEQQEKNTKKFQDILNAYELIIKSRN